MLVPLHNLGVVVDLLIGDAADVADLISSRTWAESLVCLRRAIEDEQVSELGPLLETCFGSGSVEMLMLGLGRSERIVSLLYTGLGDDPDVSVQAVGLDLQCRRR